MRHLYWKVFSIHSAEMEDLTSKQLSSSIYSLARNKLPVFFQLNTLPKERSLEQQLCY